ncbi:MAG: RHS repeat-associated core domain-containing protein, partial [Treponemataceae bacterium]|nr:RHS repeat-associated core domain-containing protein [Treponemataceae bacterium]
MGKYDECGNRITKETPFGKITYKYDSENRLIGSTSFGTENQKNLYIKNEYDKNGNLLKSISPQKEIYYTYNAENRIETVLIIDHVHKTKTEESYFYDSFGRRVKEIKNGIEVYYQYEGLSFNLLTETMYKVDFLEKGDFELDSELNLSFDSNYKNSYDFSSENLAYRYRYISDEVKPVSTKSYYYKDGNLVANADTRSSAYFFSDYQGSTRYVTDTEGFSESYNYDSFGKPIYNGNYVEYEDGYFVEGLSKSDLETSGYETYKTTNWLTKREENLQSSLYQAYLSVAGYSGKSYNQDTGLNNYGFRDYSPTQARFITVDPIRDGTNWYTLAVNNPVCFVDLCGLCTGDKKASVWDNYKGSGNPYEGVETEKLYNII